MHRFLLRNTANDPRTLSLRRANSGKILERPVVGGLRLAPRGSKIVLIHEITELMLKDIERLSAIGNIEFLTVGKVGGVADLDAIRRVRKWEVPVLGQMQDTIMVDEIAEFQVDSEPGDPRPAPEAPDEPLLLTPDELLQEAIEEAVRESAPTVVLNEPALVSLNETIEVTQEPESPLPEPAASSAPAAPVEEAPSSEPEGAPPAPRYTLESIDELKFKELAVLVEKEGGKPLGKSKETLRQFLLAL